MEELKVFAGRAHPALAQSICDYLGMPLGKCEVSQFSNENIFVRILENVRARDVFIIQPICSPVNTNLVELLIMLDAFWRASAGRITAVIPYYGYGRTDKKDQPRVPITARLVADLITTAGASRAMMVDLHAGQIQGFFNIPVDELSAQMLIAKYIRKKQLDNIVVVATDIGISKKSRDMAARLNAPLAIVEKRRIGNNDQTETLNIIGDVRGKTAITFDDEIDTAGSLVNAVNALLNEGATEVYSCASHPVLSGPAIERLAASPVKEIIVANTIPLPDSKKLDKITVLPLAPLLGEAIHRVHTGLSVGAMYDE
ncbi:MAG: ribose-phosphate pyrophosphokinase [Dehalococcoidia bacterium]|jgi:ribose-phosphate pyrophosphokinase|nr:ribose-phosphate pyrophosphokinase [Dehalococcoidia bacterium]